jgi:hypothetical protein
MSNTPHAPAATEPATDALTGMVTDPATRRGRPARRFAVHYLEMVLAMVAGMVILGPLESLALNAAGWSSALDDAGVNAMVMATNMTFAMAGWMRFRGHTIRPIVEMSAAMYLPFLVLLVPLWHGVITHNTFVVVGHVLMLLGMLLAMLARPADYIGHHATDLRHRWRQPMVFSS